ncbi:hypothetical protein FRB93_001510 [Tulasnella sp. JGI-2019a]|nr:hypothetical protein FRB93_001510 [Tulasnella sp. JGI-2019a]
MLPKPLRGMEKSTRRRVFSPARRVSAPIAPVADEAAITEWIKDLDNQKEMITIDITLYYHLRSLLNKSTPLTSLRPPFILPPSSSTPITPSSSVANAMYGWGYHSLPPKDLYQNSPSPSAVVHYSSTLSKFLPRSSMTRESTRASFYPLSPFINI